MTGCPDLVELERDPTSGVRDHLGACSSCRIVVELVDERRRGLDARDRQDECARFEMPIAARQGRRCKRPDSASPTPISGSSRCSAAHFVRGRQLEPHSRPLFHFGAHTGSEVR